MVEGLRDGDARALLSSVLRVPLDERVRERIVAETRGNPLALLELPRGLTPAELAGGFGLPDAPGLSGRIEDSFRRRVARLPAETRRLLLVAAAEPVGDPVLVWRAAERLGIGLQAASETDGLLAIGARVTFRHPLVRSAVYRAASPEDRQAVHRALADATDPEVDPDRRAWHLAQATPGFDEDVAAELERSAGRAQARGGLAAAAAFLERAAVADARALAPRRASARRGTGQAPSRRVRRGTPTGCHRRVRTAGRAPARPGRPAARPDRVRVEPRQRRSTPVAQGSQALRTARSAGSRVTPIWTRSPPCSLPACWRATRACWRPPGRQGSASIAAASARVRSAAGWPGAADHRGIRRRNADVEKGGRRLPTRGRVGRGRASVAVARSPCSRHSCGTTRAWDVLSARFVQLARDAGALSVLPLALATRSAVRLFAGEFAVASSLLEEVVAVNEATGASLAPYVGLAHVTFQGREAEATPLIEAATRELVRRRRRTGAEIHSLGDCRAPQRPGPLRGGARRGAAGRRGQHTLRGGAIGDWWS